MSEDQVLQRVAFGSLGPKRDGFEPHAVIDDADEDFGARIGLGLPIRQRHELPVHGLGEHPARFVGQLHDHEFFLGHGRDERVEA